MRVGPPWLGAGGAVGLVICGAISMHLGMRRLNQIAGYALAAALTFAVLFGVARLVSGVFAHAETAPVMLRSAAILWMTNVITFSLWYWRLDAGGPNERARHRGARSGAFLFPQMMEVSDPLPDEVSADWRPHFVDYLFLAFNTSTAFSPTDVPVLSRWAKVLTMMQSIISFTTVVLLVARAINTI
jgi:hypothetical protein